MKGAAWKEVCQTVNHQSYVHLATKFQVCLNSIFDFIVIPNKFCNLIRFKLLDFLFRLKLFEFSRFSARVITCFYTEKTLVLVTFRKCTNLRV